MTIMAVMLMMLVGPLLCGGLLQRLAKRTLVSNHTLGCLGVTLILLYAGIGHFAIPDFFVAMIPTWLPARLEAVYITGILEIVLGLAILPLRFRTAAGWMSILMLLMFLPVNIYAAIHNNWGVSHLLVRIPLQFVMLGWIWWHAVRPSGTRERSHLAGAPS